MAESTKSDWNPHVCTITKLEPHPNAHSLSIAEVEGLPVVVRTIDFKLGDKAVYIPVDTVVDVQLPEFAFLSSPRIKAARLRGVYSQGLLVRPSTSWDGILRDGPESALKLVKYVSPRERALEAHPSSKGLKRRQKDPMPIYGLDAYRRFPDVLKDGEQVVITEKIHGCNARFAYLNGRFYVGSHRVLRGVTMHRFTSWVVSLVRSVKSFCLGRRLGTPLEKLGDVWWAAARKYNLEAICRRYPGYVFYGEIYGHGIQDLTYDATPGSPAFVLFDVYDVQTSTFLRYNDVRRIGNETSLPFVPELFRGVWSKELLGLRTGTSLLAPKQIREGIVVKADPERKDFAVGRVCLKVVSEEYLLRKDGDK